MDKITFLVADEMIKQSIERTLWTYRDNFSHRSLVTEIAIIDFPHIIEQTQAMIRNGTKIIITNSGSHQILSHAQDTHRIDIIPILCLYSSTNDALYTIRQVDEKYKKIHLLLNKHFMFNINACPEDIRQKLVLYPPYSIDDTPDMLLQLVHKIPAADDAAIVGCTLLPQVAPQLSMPIYPIRPSESAILSAYQYANELIDFNKKERKQLSILTSILSHVDEGIILYDDKGAISHINSLAQTFLNASETPKTIRDIFSNMGKKSNLPPLKEKILQRPPYTLVANSAPFQLDNTKHHILILRDVTELQRLEKNVRYKLAKTGLTANHHFDDILTVNTEMRSVIHTAQIMAAHNAPVLIQGESGTGKELFAQSIHNASSRRNGPFVAVNCAALPPELLESELFGYVGGSFTGARKEGKAGYFELAHTGTIFLDEINSMSPNIQSKLLRVLETKQIMRIGSDYVIPLDLRIISASNANLLQAVQDGQFRRDLFFRLNALTLTLPALNDRPDDILYLFNYFIKQEIGKKITLSPELKTALLNHHWWGNIRELYSAAFRYHIFGETGDVSYSYLFDQPQKNREPLLNKDSLRIDMKQLHHSVEHLIIQDLLAQGFTKSQIAKTLNISRQTLFNKLKEN